MYKNKYTLRDNDKFNSSFHTRSHKEYKTEFGLCKHIYFYDVRIRAKNLYCSYICIYDSDRKLKFDLIFRLYIH